MLRPSITLHGKSSCSPSSLTISPHTHPRPPLDPHPLPILRCPTSQTFTGVPKDSSILLARSLLLSTSRLLGLQCPFNRPNQDSISPRPHSRLEITQPTHNSSCVWNLHQECRYQIQVPCQQRPPYRLRTVRKRSKEDRTTGLMDPPLEGIK